MKQEISGAHSIQEYVYIPTYKAHGTVQRLSAAGDVIYYHVLLEGTQTPITLRQHEIFKSIKVDSNKAS